MKSIIRQFFRSRLGDASCVPALILLVTVLFAPGAALAVVVATPTFTPPAGTYNGSQSVTIATTTPGASIRYTVDGTTPSSTVGTLYSLPVVITATKTLKAIAYASGMTNSAVNTGVYTINNTGGAALATAATYESISVVWGPTGGSEADPCSVQYREYGTSTWQDGMDLWFDPRSPAQYRGSIIGLSPGTKYEVKATLASGTTQTMTRNTMIDPSNLPIGTTVTLPTNSSTTLSITSGGTASAYKLYTAAPGQTATIDVAKLADNCISVNASFVIIRGVTCIGARTHGIQLLGGADHVIIEDCDISAWGSPDGTTGFGVNYQSGIYSSSTSLAAITVQRNLIHNPSTDSNSWSELHNGDYHPGGPQGITFYNSNSGNHIIRYNVITSDFTHMFNDGMGGAQNFSTGGFPGQNSDVYGNIVTHCWDNPLEIEGGGRNVRVWGNYIDDSYSPIGVASCEVGPLYVFRNVANRMIKNGSGAFDHTKFIKAGSTTWGGVYYGDGRIYLLHNTMLQEPDGAGGTRGGVSGIDGRAGDKMTNTVSLNNIWYTRQSTDGAIWDTNTTTTGLTANSFDYDLYNGVINSPSVSPEANGIAGSPTFDSGNGNMYNPFQGTLKFWLQSGTNGADAAVRIKNFNDLYAGSAPDMGANESGTPMEFGLNAYLNGGSAARQ